jgi:hypothetical protein
MENHIVRKYLANGECTKIRREGGRGGAEAEEESERGRERDIFFVSILITKNDTFLGSWHDKKRRRKFFENFALENGFDFTKAENWYSQNIDNIAQKKVFTWWAIFI